jgi:homocysteine S-methyltransferase
MRPMTRRSPEPGGTLFLTDGGLETTLIFREGYDLPCFAAFTLLEDETGRDALRAYFAPYLDIASERGAGFVLDTATWRASGDWGAALGYSGDQLADANRRAVALAQELRAARDTERTPILVNGVVGPRGDGYRVDTQMSAEDAQGYHAAQIGAFAEAGVDMVTAVTMTYADEAIGIARAAQAVGLPVVISFTVETDGRLPSGQALGEAIEQVDAATGRAPSYFMINCAHPTHFASVLANAGDWARRIGGLRANASTLSHAELDEAEELDDGDPVDLGARYRELRPWLPAIAVLGGCCGTDHRHIAEVAAAWDG